MKDVLAYWLLEKLESLEDERKAFDKMRMKNVLSWNAMIAAFAQNGFTEEALELLLEYNSQR